MKQHICRLWLSATFLCCINISQAQQVKAARPGPAGSWRLLGTTSVKFTVDKDVIWVTGADAFRRLKFKVMDAPVEILNMTVVYESGQPDNIPVRAVIPQGGESRIIDLQGTVRRIRKVSFVYKSPGKITRGTAKVALWGIK